MQMNSMGLLDILILAAVLGLALFAALARRRILRPLDRTRMRSAAWSLLSDVSQANRPSDWLVSSPRQRAHRKQPVSPKDHTDSSDGGKTQIYQKGRTV